MSRLATSLIVLVAALGAPAYAADWADDWGGADDFRGAYSDEPKDWSQVGETDDSLTFETGLRYWYSWGSQNFEINSGIPGDRGEMLTNDQSQSVEAHMRIDDSVSRVYVKGLAGMAFSTTGEVVDDVDGTTDVTNGKIGYLGADIGWSLLENNDTLSFGPAVGYMYWNDSPNTFQDNYTTAATADDITYDPVNGQTFLPGDSTPNNIDMNMLRLGFSGKINVANFFDLSAEVLAVPYAKVSGTLGAGSGFALAGLVSYDNQSSPSYGPTGLTGAVNIHDIQSSPTTIDGWGYGAMAEVMAGFHPTENLTFRLGGRAWYIEGSADAMFSRASIGDPTDSVQPVAGDPGPPVVPPEMNAPNFDTAPTYGNQDYITYANPFSLFRYGVLAELTYSF